MRWLGLLIKFIFVLALTATPNTFLPAANAVTAQDAAAEATDAANAAAEVADAIVAELHSQIDSALELANFTGISTLIDVSRGISSCNNKIVLISNKRDSVKSRYDQVQIILSDINLDSTIKLQYNSASNMWLRAFSAYQSEIAQQEREKSYFNSAQALIDNAASVQKAKQDAEAKAAAEQKAKQDAGAKAAAEKVIADAKLEAVRILAAAKLAANKKTTITCIKGKLTKKVTAIKPKCPSGYKVKK